MNQLIAADHEIRGAEVQARTFCLMVYPESFEEGIIAILDELGLPGFTQFQKVTGRGSRGRHYDTAIWPGADGAIFSVLTDTQAGALSAAATDFSNSLESRTKGLFGVRLFTWPCLQVA